MKILIGILTISAVACLTEGIMLSALGKVPTCGIVWALGALCAFLAYDLNVADKKKKGKKEEEAEKEK